MKEEYQGMDIKVGKYTIKSDSQCMWIVEEREAKKKDGKTRTEKIIDRATGYHTNLYDLAKSFIDRKTRTEAASTLKQELKVIANARGDAIKAVKAVLEKVRKK